MTTRKRTTKAQQPKADETKAAQEAEAKNAQEAEAKAAQEAEAKAAQEAEAKAAKDGPSQEKPQEPAPQPPAPKAHGGAKGEIPALFVRTRKRYGSRRRAGFRFTQEGLGIALSALTDEQLEALHADPTLEVEECTVPADDDGEPEV